MRRTPVFGTVTGVPVPSFIAELREPVGHRLLRIASARAVVLDDDARVLFGHDATTGGVGLAGGHRRPGRASGRCPRPQVPIGRVPRAGAELGWHMEAFFGCLCYCAPAEALVRAVRVGAVRYRRDDDRYLLVLDQIQHAVLAAAG